MSLDDKDKDKLKKKIVIDEQDSEDESGQGTTGGGASGQIEFKDFLANAANLRDDLLPADEKRRLLSVHQDAHELNVQKQKDIREQRQAVKDGKISLQTFQNGLMGAGMNAQYKTNPVLANKAQFSGIDRQVNALPTENIADTNDANRNELENQYRLRYAPESAPRFNPKPQFRQ